MISQTAGKGTFAFEGAHRVETDTYGLSGAYLIFVNFVYAQKYISLKKKSTLPPVVAVVTEMSYDQVATIENQINHHTASNPRSSHRDSM